MSRSRKVIQEFKDYVVHYRGTNADDVVTFHKGGGHIETLFGNDSVTVSLYADHIDLGEGNDFLHLVTGSFGRLTLGNGNNAVTSASNGYIAHVTGGGGVDDVTLGSTVGHVALGGGDDHLVVQRSVHHLDTGAGADSLIVGGTDRAHLGEGGDFFRSTGWANQVFGDGGDDRMVMTAGGHGHGGDGNDVFHDYGHSATSFAGDAGDDTFVLHYTRKHDHLRFNGGDGSDTLRIEVEQKDADSGNIDHILDEFINAEGDFGGEIRTLNMALHDVEHVRIFVGGNEVLFL